MVIAATTNIREFREAQSILLPALANMTLDQTAVLLGVGRSSVPRLQRNFRERRKTPEASSRRWGGRRRSLMTWEEEKVFLKPWAEQASTAGILVVSPLRAALSESLGRRVTHSVVYRLLARHGWRKIAPDTKHPKSDPAAQAEWKKNSPKRWQPC
jgi:transposase